MKSCLEFILVTLTLAAVFSVVFYTMKTGMSPMPSSNAMRKVMLEALVRHGRCGMVMELGAGWGGLARSAGRLAEVKRVVAVELSPLPWAWSRLMALLAGATDIAWERASIYDSDLTRTDALLCYLSPVIMSRLKPQFESQLKPGSVVISAAFAVPGWTPVEMIKVPDVYGTPVYVYDVEIQ